MTTLDQQYRNVLIFLIVVILAGSGYWILKHFRPALFLGEPNLIASAEAALPVSSEGQGEPLPPQPVPKLQRPPSSSEIVVHITGAVQSPGVYRLSTDARIQDAIEKAGGTTASADVHRLNLATKVRDGQQICVPESPQVVSSFADVQRNPHTNSTLLSSPASLNQPSTRTSSPLEESLINLNTATSEQLQTLPRIGPVAAQRIIEYRETYGPFSTVEELTTVKGIGQKTLEKIQHLIVVY